jgi:hypothetical protein
LSKEKEPERRGCGKTGGGGLHQKSLHFRQKKKVESVTPRQAAKKFWSQRSRKTDLQERKLQEAR